MNQSISVQIKFYEIIASILLKPCFYIFYSRVFSRRLISVMINYNRFFLGCLFLILGILIAPIFFPGYVFDTFKCPSLSETRQSESPMNIVSSNVQIVNTSETINADFPCITTKKLLNHFSTSICLHDSQKDMYVSEAFRENTTIWEEDGVVRILELLLRHPHLDFIDIGANIGAYSMYAAALGRFVLAIECFGPNIQRLHRAIQLANIGNRILVIQNAIFSQSGQMLRLSNVAFNVGAQRINPTRKEANSQSAINDPYLVKTIILDDLVPLVISRGIRGAIMKIDIEGSEAFLVESGRQFFDTLEIPFVQMEWMNVKRYSDRVNIILKFFGERNYQSLTLTCQPLDLANTAQWPNDVFWIKKDAAGFC